MRAQLEALAVELVEAIGNGAPIGFVEPHDMHTKRFAAALSLAILFAATFVATVGSASADPGYTRATLPTANLFNRTDRTVKVEFREGGAVKRSMVLYKGSSIYPVELQGTFVMSGIVDVDAKSVSVTQRTVVLKLGASLNISVAPNGSGGFQFRDGT